MAAIAGDQEAQRLSLGTKGPRGYQRGPMAPAAIARDQGARRLSLAGQHTTVLKKTGFNRSFTTESRCWAFVPKSTWRVVFIERACRFSDIATTKAEHILTRGQNNQAFDRRFLWKPISVIGNTNLARHEAEIEIIECLCRCLTNRALA